MKKCLLFPFLFILLILFIQFSLFNTVSNHIVLETKTCEKVIVPGLVTISHNVFWYLSSYAWISNTLYIISLGPNFFDKEREKKLKHNRSLDLALNKTFPYSYLYHPNDFIEYVELEGFRILCKNTPTIRKDETIYNKINMLQCEFPNTFKFTTLVLKMKLKNTSKCLIFELSTPKGRIASFSKRTLSQPLHGFSMCVGGIRDFNFHAKELILRQLDELKPSHSKFV
jgi:hypothetical protein